MSNKLKKEGGTVMVLKVGEPLETRYTSNEDEIWNLAKAVTNDAMLECFYFGEGVECFCDEDGIRKRLDLNFFNFATKNGEPILGNVVFCTFTDDGRIAGLTTKQMEHIRKNIVDTVLCIEYEDGSTVKLKVS